LEAVVRVYNRWGRRDNIYKARIKILVKAEGKRYTDEVEAEYQRILAQDGAPHTITQAEFDRVQASFVTPQLIQFSDLSAESIHSQLAKAADTDKDFARWLQQNVAPHRNPHLRVVTLSFKRLGQAPGDATADQLDAAAELADRFSASEARVSHDQNLVLPWVCAEQLPTLYQAAKSLGLAKPNIRMLTDMIACPGETIAHWPMPVPCLWQRPSPNIIKTWTNSLTWVKSIYTSADASILAAITTAAILAFWEWIRMAKSGIKSRSVARMVRL
ncbi:MAG: hypothetical protein ACKO69_01750, partial [Limnohabitans sp.]